MAGWMLYDRYLNAGKEFRNKEFMKFLKENQIIPYHIYSHLKASVAERFIRTLMTSLARYMTERGTKKIDNVLADFTAKYNGSFHRSIGMKPNEVTKDNQDEVWRRMYDSYFRELDKPRKPPKYTVGQKIRLSREKLLFEKGK